jgi:hypothetical protein
MMGPLCVMGHVDQPNVMLDPARAGAMVPAGTVLDPQAMSARVTLSGAYRGWFLYDWPKAIRLAPSWPSTCLVLLGQYVH